MTDDGGETSCNLLIANLDAGPAQPEFVQCLDFVT